MRVLISGMGIAGACLAYWLLEYGFEPVLLERASQLRRSGYIIDFWGSGFDIAERMGLVERIRAEGYAVRELRIVNGAGKRVGGFSVRAIERLVGERYTSLPRGALAGALYDALAGRAELRFDDSITELSDSGSDVRVRFEKGAPQRFDAVVGADGLHSVVRRLVFGEQSRFEHYLGYKVAAFEASGYPQRDESAYVMFAQVGQQITRFSLRDDRSVFLFVLSDAEASAVSDETPTDLLQRRFAASGWECREILAAMQTAPEVYFDRVSQIRMPRWSRGRIGLIGDACGCVSLLAGQGASLAMLGAYVLAGELKTCASDPERAFVRYEERLRPAIAEKQRAAERFANSFTPRSGVALWLRNHATRLLSLPFVAHAALRASLRDPIALPDYRHAG